MVRYIAAETAYERSQIAEGLFRKANDADLIALSHVDSAAEEQTGPEILAPRVDRFVWWLPADTETLVVSQGPFTFSLPLPDDDEATFLEMVRVVPAGLFAGVHDGLLLKELRGLNVLVAIEGSRRFRGPKGLGSMPYDGCQIVQFDEASHGAVQRAFQSCLKRAPETIRLVDSQVAVFRMRWEDDIWTLHVAQPEAGLLLCATDRVYLETILQRREQKAQARALPDDLPEWRHIDLKAPVWALRHYRREGAEHDPSSPLQGKAAANVPDPQALGFVFWYDGASQTAKARYLSGSPRAVQLVTRGWNRPDDELKLTSPSPSRAPSKSPRRSARRRRQSVF